MVREECTSFRCVCRADTPCKRFPSLCFTAHMEPFRFRVDSITIHRKVQFIKIKRRVLAKITSNSNKWGQAYVWPMLLISHDSRRHRSSRIKIKIIKTITIKKRGQSISSSCLNLPPIVAEYNIIYGDRSRNHILLHKPAESGTTTAGGAPVESESVSP